MRAQVANAGLAKTAVTAGTQWSIARALLANNIRLLAMTVVKLFSSIYPRCTVANMCLARVVEREDNGASGCSALHVLLDGCASSSTISQCYPRLSSLAVFLLGLPLLRFMINLELFLLRHELLSLPVAFPSLIFDLFSPFTLLLISLSSLASLYDHELNFLFPFQLIQGQTVLAQTVTHLLMMERKTLAL